MTSHPITVYRHGADLLLSYPLMWNVTLEHTTTHFNVFGVRIHYAIRSLTAVPTSVY